MAHIILAISYGPDKLYNIIFDRLYDKPACDSTLFHRYNFQPSDLTVNHKLHQIFRQFNLKILAGGGRNPRALPNNMCCPFTKTEGIKGTPYNAAVNGCCGTRLYDLMAQDCCEDVGRVLDKVSQSR